MGTSVQWSGFSGNGWTNTAQGWVQNTGGTQGFRTVVTTSMKSVTMQPLPAESAIREPCHAYRPDGKGQPCQVCGFGYHNHPEYTVELLLAMRKKLDAPLEVSRCR